MPRGPIGEAGSEVLTHIERGESGQHLNFDFLVENRTGRELRLARVELSVLDAGGQVVRRDFVDGASRWFGHLKQGSVRVRPGQMVARGRSSGRWGRPGTAWPHTSTTSCAPGPGSRASRGCRRTSAASAG